MPKIAGMPAVGEIGGDIYRLLGKGKGQGEGNQASKCEAHAQMRDKRVGPLLLLLTKDKAIEWQSSSVSEMVTNDYVNLCAPTL